MVFHILFSKKEGKFMDELSIEDRKYLFKKFKEIKIPFQDKTGCFFEFKEKMRKFHLKLFDKKAEYWFPEVQILRIYIDDHATNMYIRVGYYSKRERHIKKVTLVDLDIKQKIVIDKIYKEIEV